MVSIPRLRVLAFSGLGRQCVAIPRLRMIAFSALAAASLALAATAPGWAVDGSSVIIKDFAYSPSTVQVRVGDTVTWTNYEEAVPHDVTSGSFGSPNMGQVFASPFLNNGESYSVTFNEPGEYSYVCRLHPNMYGVVIVSPE